MHPILISLVPLTIHSFGLMAALGYLAAIIVSLSYARKEGLSAPFVLDLALVIIISSILGARLLYVIGQWDYYRDHLPEIIMLQQGGLVVLGGVISSMIAVNWFAKKRGLSTLKVFDLLAPGLSLGLAIGRLGCFLNGCCFGLPASLPWGVVFPLGSLAHSYFPGEQLHPTQLYSVLGLLLVYLAVVIIYRLKKYDGQVFFWWAILYSINRFIVEIFRFSPLHWLGLTPSQWIVLCLAGVGIYNLLTRAHASQA